jgi:hypothetical protein
MFLANDSHYLVTKGTGTRERVEFGRYIPLTQKAAKSFVKSHGGRVIKRTTARKLNLI